MPMLGAPIGPYVFGAGLLGVLFTMLSWWGDVIRESKQGDHTRVVQISLRYGMILFIASEVMVVVAWFWAYFDVSLFPSFSLEYLRTDSRAGTGAEGGVDHRRLPPAAGQHSDPADVGHTITWAHHAMLLNDRRSVSIALILTVLLGRCSPACRSTNTWTPLRFQGQHLRLHFFMATGFHGFHASSARSSWRSA